MVLITKNRTLLGLARKAYQRAKVTEDQALIVWSSRIYLHASAIIVESACPIYLDKIVEQLRIFIGEIPRPPGHFIWVRAVGNRARRWRPWRERLHLSTITQATGEEGR